LRAFIVAYRWLVSPFLGHACRHEPSCSAYASEAIERHGSWRGLWLAAARVSRCHPWGSHGFDPVPDHLTERHGILSAWKYGRWSPGEVMKQTHANMHRSLAGSANAERAEQ
jgi:putative membrane protein insertion efficiency factor